MLGSQAALYHFHGIPKTLSEKLFGVFKHTLLTRTSSFSGIRRCVLRAAFQVYRDNKDDVLKVRDLEILSESEKAGIYIVSENNGRRIYISGHPEYDPLTLRDEYQRDLGNGLDIDLPENYFPDNDPLKYPVVNWRSHANLLFSNWLNYYVYQETPYNLEEITG